jgi:uncharacterized membrane protein YjjB (DUF3815 family)
MPLVPGILITNAIRDLLAGELLAGMSRGVEAALTAFAIGAGVAIVPANNSPASKSRIALVIKIPGTRGITLAIVIMF